MAATIAPITVEDYLVLPETGPRYQLVEGSLHIAPAPNRFHQHISRKLTVIISVWIDAGGGGEVYNAPFDVYLDNTNVYQPDLLYVSPDNLAILTDAGASGAPDLIVEILSPGTRKLDLGPKKKNFARSGVREFWAIDPAALTVEVFDLGADPNSPVRNLRHNDRLESAILPGLTIDLAEVFDF